MTGRLGFLALALAGLLAACAGAPKPTPPTCLCGTVIHVDGTRNDVFRACFTSEISFIDLRSAVLHPCEGRPK